jgi:anti-sigma factor RsiW
MLVVRGLGCGMWPRGHSSWAGALAVGLIACAALPLAAPLAHGETLESALVEAYRNNPSLNATRASVRATDENVPQALSGYRPKITVTASGGEQSLSSTVKELNPLSSTRPLWCGSTSCPP